MSTDSDATMLEEHPIDKENQLKKAALDFIKTFIMRTEGFCQTNGRPESGALFPMCKDIFIIILNCVCTGHEQMHYTSLSVNVSAQSNKRG